MKQVLSSCRLKRIDHPEAARWLTSAEAVNVLRPFLGREATVTDAAEVLQLSVKDTYYRVQRLCKLGVLEVVREERRAGRPLKYYSTNCEQLFVPFALTPTATVAQRLLQQTIPTQEAIAVSMSEHMERDHGTSRLGFVLLASGGKVTSFLAPEDGQADWSLCEYWLAPQTAAMYTFAGGYRLERHRAKEIQSRLDELLSDILAYEQEAEGSTTAQPYRCLLSFAPSVAR